MLSATRWPPGSGSSSRHRASKDVPTGDGIPRACRPVPTQIVDPARRTDSPLQEVRHALIGIGQSQTADERVSENENLLRRRIEVFAVAVDICSDLARVVSHPREVAKDGSQIVDAARIACCRRSRGLEGANHPMLCLQVWISQLGKTHRPPDRDALPPLLVAPHQF